MHASARKNEARTNEARNNVYVHARMCVCVIERESEISKTKVLCWNPIVRIHMVPELELTLGIRVRDMNII